MWENIGIVNGIAREVQSKNMGIFLREKRQVQKFREFGKKTL